MIVNPRARGQRIGCAFVLLVLIDRLGPGPLGRQWQLGAEVAFFACWVLVESFLVLRARRERIARERAPEASPLDFGEPKTRAELEAGLAGNPDGDLDLQVANKRSGVL